MTHFFRRTIVPLCFCVWLCAGLALAVFAQEGGFSAQLTRESRLKVFEQVWRAINESYYDRNFHGVDWGSQRIYYRPKIENASSNLEFYRLLRAMIGKLGDAHTRIYSPEDGFDRYRPAGTTIGVTVRRVEGRAVVTAVEPNSEATRNGVRPGLVINRVDDLPIDSVLRQMQEDVGASSTPIARDLQSMDRIFYGPRDSLVKIEFLTEEGVPLTVKVTRRYVEFQRRVTYRVLPYNIGYIELSGFGPEIERDFEQAMQALRNTRGMVLDLRNNGGGFVSTVTQVASYFFPEETDLGEFVTRQGRVAKRRTLRVREQYRAPLALLVSSRSASGSEILAAALQEYRRGVIIGANQTTCGCLLGVSRTLRLDDGGKLNISDTDYRTATGRRIEGLGVRPDLQVDLRIADLLDGRDSMIEAGLNSLSRLFLFGTSNAKAEFKLAIPAFELFPLSRSLPSSQVNR